MRLLTFVPALGILLGAAALDASGPAVAKDTTEPTHKEKVVALLNSLESGDPAPVSFVNPNKYIQHNLSVADGLEGFAELMKHIPPGSVKVDVKRVFRDGDYVFTHSEYEFFGPKVGFDIFRFEDGLIVEHWDNLQPRVEKTASGRSQTDGPTQVMDSEKTAENKALIESLFRDVFFGANPQAITQYINAENYAQHNPAVGDGLDALMQALQEMAKAGTPMVYNKMHKMLGEGNFVLTVSEGSFLGKPTAFYDLFRIDSGQIVEHWDALETIPPETEWKNTNGKFGFR